MVTEMGVITPPVGINVYVVYGVAKNVLEKEVPLDHPVLTQSHVLRYKNRLSILLKYSTFGD